MGKKKVLSGVQRKLSKSPANSMASCFRSWDDRQHIEYSLFKVCANICPTEKESWELEVLSALSGSKAVHPSSSRHPGEQRSARASENTFPSLSIQEQRIKASSEIKKFLFRNAEGMTLKGANLQISLCSLPHLDRVCQVWLSFLVRNLSFAISSILWLLLSYERSGVRCAQLLVLIECM
jgi:hypothetical protein